VADGSTTKQFRPSASQSLRSPPRHGNPTLCVRCRQIRIYRESNPDALIDAFFELAMVTTTSQPSMS